ncbi:MAG: cysteine desulfurase family protein [Verrucomicrobiales bacterium]
MSDVVYLDHNATTPVDPEVLDSMLPFLKQNYGNASSAYRLGKTTRLALDQARQELAQLLRCQPEHLIFTGNGTEANNAVFASVLDTDPDRQHIITTAVEHSAIIKHGEYLAKRGIEITFLPVDRNGQVDLDRLAKAIRSDTILVSIMWANNETGVISDIPAIAELCQQKNVLFHTDAVQAVGKAEVYPSELPIHFLSISGHKLYAPKGVGALYVRPRTRFTPYLHGGSQEFNKRAGTENVASIVGLGTAARLATENLPLSVQAMQHLRDHFEKTLARELENVEINGHPQQRLANTSNLSFAGIDGEAALMLLDDRGICCSAGSACTTGSLKPSHVLSAMGLTTEQARSSLRFSLGKNTTQSDIDHALQKIVEVVTKLRSLQPKMAPSNDSSLRSLAAVGARAE